MCLIRYADALSGGPTSPLLTIQNFIIENRREDRLGLHRSAILGSRSIESGSANLVVRPAVGDMR